MTSKSRFLATTLAAILFTIFAPTPSEAGHFALAFQRKLSGWENSAAPGCAPQNLGGGAIRIWIWDEAGNPMPNVRVENFDIWQHNGTTDEAGRLQLDWQSKNNFTLRLIDGTNSTFDECQPFIKDIEPCRDRHSYEIGYLYKTSEDNPSYFDLGLHCSWPETDTYFNKAPYTKSLTYSGVDCTDYFSDYQSALKPENLPAYWGQTFIATADRIVAARVQGTQDKPEYLVDWNLQIVTFPELQPVGPIAYVPMRHPFGWEAYWGINDNPVIPGQKYMLKIWPRTVWINLYYVPRDVYPDGEFYEGATPRPGYDLNGHIVAMWSTPPPPTGDVVLLLELDKLSGIRTPDSSGYEHHAALYGDPTWLPDAGKMGGALQFDGIDDILATLDFRGITGQNSRTVAAWIKTDSDNFEDIVAWGFEEPGQRWSLVTGVMDGAFGIYVVDGFSFGVTNVCDGEWHHIAAALRDDGSPDVDEVRLYADGKAEATTIFSKQIDTAEGYVLTAATFPDGSDRYFEGLIDQIAVFDFAMNDEQISRLCHVGAQSFLEECGGFRIDEAYLLDADISGNCEVNGIDLALLAKLWLETGLLLPADIYKDESVDWLDLQLLAETWTDTIPPPVK